MEIVHVNHPNSFWVQYTKANKDILIRIEEIIEHVVRKHGDNVGFRRRSEIAINSVVLAKFDDGHETEW